MREISPSMASTFSIPAELGQVTDRVTGDPAAPVLIHIQSAHGNYQAEKNTEKLLAYIEKHSSVRLMLLEGATGKLQPQYFRLFPEHSKFNRKVTDKLMKEGYLTGPETFLIESASEIEAWGIENIDDYKKDRDAFISVVRSDKTAESFLLKLRVGIDKRFTLKLNKDLLDIVRKEVSFSSGAISFESWLKTLAEGSKKYLKRDLTDTFYQDQYPFLIRYFQVQAISSKIDRDKAHREAKAFLTELVSQKVSKEVIANFETMLQLSETKLLRNVSRTTDGYSTLRRAYDLAFNRLPKDFVMTQWPNWKLYSQYIILLQEMEGQGLHEEILKLKDTIQTSLAKTTDEKEYLAKARELYLLRCLLKLELTRPEYDELTQTVKTADIQEIGALYKTATDFYATAVDRENKMFNNALKRMSKQKQDRAVIVTGGFHADGLKKLAASRHCAYIRITPRINKITKRDRGLYLKSMMGERDFGASQAVPLLGVNPIKVRVFVTGAEQTQDWRIEILNLTKGMIHSRNRSEHTELFAELSHSFFGNLKNRKGSLRLTNPRSVIARAEVRGSDEPGKVVKFESGHKETTDRLSDAIRLVLSSQLEVLAADASTGLKPNQIQGILEAVTNGSLKLKGEDIDIIKVVNGQEVVIGAIDRNVAHKYALLHRVPTTFIVTPEGKFLFQRRAHNIVQPLKLALFGGHVQSGSNYRETVKEEILDELKLPKNWKVDDSRLKVIRTEGGFEWPTAQALKEDLNLDRNNREIRSHYIYFASEEEVVKIRETGQLLDRKLRESQENWNRSHPVLSQIVKILEYSINRFFIIIHNFPRWSRSTPPQFQWLNNFKEAEFRRWLEAEQKEKNGLGEVWSIHEYTLNEIMAAENKNKLATDLLAPLLYHSNNQDVRDALREVALLATRAELVSLMARQDALPEKADLILVFVGGDIDGKVPKAVADMYMSYPEGERPRILFSGIGEETKPESVEYQEKLQKILVERGVLNAEILTETTATDMETNAKNSRAVLIEKSLDPQTIIFTQAPFLVLRGSVAADSAFPGKIKAVRAAYVPDLSSMDGAKFDQWIAALEKQASVIADMSVFGELSLNVAEKLAEYNALSARSEIRLDKASTIFMVDMSSLDAKIGTAIRLASNIVSPRLSVSSVYSSEVSPELFAGTRHYPMISAIPPIFAANWPMMNNIISRSGTASTERMVIDQRQGASDAVSVRPLVTFALYNPRATVVLALIAKASETDAFKKDLVALIQESELPRNFSVRVFADENEFVEAFEGFYNNAAPLGKSVALITDSKDSLITHKISSRRHLLSVVGTQNPLEQTAATLLAADQLLNESIWSMSYHFISAKKLGGLETLMAELTNYVAAQVKVLASA